MQFHYFKSQAIDSQQFDPLLSGVAKKSIFTIAQSYI